MRLLAEMEGFDWVNATDAERIAFRLRDPARGFGFCKDSCVEQYALLVQTGERRSSGGSGARSRICDNCGDPVPPGAYPPSDVTTPMLDFWSQTYTETLTVPSQVTKAD